MTNKDSDIVGENYLKPKYLRIIAKVIGHHFWNCPSDEVAVGNGLEIARKIEKAIIEEMNNG